MQFGIVTALLALVALAFGIFLRRPRGVDPAETEVVSVVRKFAGEMEEENDRLVEMVAKLRQRIDEAALRGENQDGALRTEIRRLEERVMRTEQSLERLARHRDGGGPEAAAIPDYLTPKYQEVARRILAGQDPQEIVRELAIGRGEVELVTRLLEHGVEVP